MDFKRACKKAMSYFKEEWNDIGFDSIKDLGDKWLFNGCDGIHDVVYGKEGITIDKKTGELRLFFLPDEKNFELMDKGVELDIPQEYRVNN